MHPILIELGPLTIHTYGVFIAAAFLAAMAWTAREARQRGLAVELVQDLGFWCLIGAILGSRLLYVLLNLDYFLEHPLETVMFWKGGLVFLGGGVLAALLAVRMLKKHGQPLLPWADCVAPALALGQAVGRFGCLAAGCCYGAKCDLPWAITFTDPDSLAPLLTPLHPTQIYEILAGATNFVILLVAKRWVREPGRIMGLFLMVYAVFRITIEFFRDDYRGDIAGVVSVTQVLAAAAFCLGAWLFISKRRRSRA